jgi:hypothetical protein
MRDNSAAPVLGLVVMAALLVGLVLWSTAPSTASATAEEPVATTTPDAASRAAVPRIDTDLPAKTETATFALG